MIRSTSMKEGDSPAERLSPPRLFCKILSTFFFLLLLLFTPWYYGLTLYRHQLAAQILIFGFAGVVLFLRPRFFAISKTPSDRTILMGLAISAISVPLSPLIFQSFLSFTAFLALLGVYFSARAFLKSANDLRVLFWGMLISAAFYAGYGFFQYYGPIAHDYWYQPDFLASRYVNGGHFAGFLLFGCYAALALAAFERNAAAKALAFSMLPGILWALLLTRSRTVWGAMAFSALIFLCLAIRHSLIKMRVWFLIAILGAGGGTFFVLKGGAEQIFRRLQELIEYKFFSVFQRFDIWQGALKAIAARPWGWGPGTFSAVFPLHRVHNDRFLIDFAHNEILQIGVECGLAGMVLLLFLFFQVWRSGLQALKNPAGESGNKIQIALGLAFWTALFISSQFDFPLRIYASAVYLACFMAIQAYFLPAPLPGEGAAIFEGPRARPVYLFAARLLVFIFLAFDVTQLLAQRAFDDALRAGRHFKWQKSEARFSEALRWSPWSANYHQALGELYKKKSEINSSAEERARLRRLGIQAFKSAIRLNPLLASNYYLLAALYESDGKIEQAQANFKKAISRDPTNAYYVMEHGNFALRQSRVEEAIDSFSRFKDFKFRDGGDADICEILKRCSKSTLNYDLLKRIIPDDFGHHQCLGQVLGENSRWEDAEKEFFIALEQGRASTADFKAYHDHIRNPITAFYVARKRPQDALEIYRRELLKNPEDEAARRNFDELSKIPEVSVPR